MDEEFVEYKEITDTIKMIKSISLNPLIDGINSSEYASLKMLDSLMHNSENKTVYVSQITKRLNISAPSVSKLLNSLEEKGMVVREVDKHNRRNTIVVITEKGLDIKEKTDMTINDFIADVQAKVGVENIREFQYLASLIHKAIAQEIKELEERRRKKEVNTL